jgi:hypothetical protein
MVAGLLDVLVKAFIANLSFRVLKRIDEIGRAVAAAARAVAVIAFDRLGEIAR